VNEVDVMKWAMGVLAAIVAWLWQRNEKRWDDHGAGSKAMADRMTALELKIAGELPTSADFDKFSDQVMARLDKLDSRVEKMSDIVIALETQAKLQAQAAQHTQG
jgi:endo-1,4-beta-D-glucanase Y